MLSAPLVAAVASVALATSAAAMPSRRDNSIPDAVGNIQFNISVPPMSPILEWLPGLRNDQMPNETAPYYWTPSVKDPYYMNFSDYQTYKQYLPNSPTVQVNAFANDVIIWGKFQGWNTSGYQDPPLNVDANGNTSQISMADALNTVSTDILVQVQNMSDGLNTVSLALNDGLRGGAALTVELVTITTYMQLATKEKSISWNATVNQTEVAFADNGQISSYLSCDSEWAVDGNGTVKMDGNNNGGKKCTIPIPAKTSYVILRGTLGPQYGGIKISGLGNVDYMPNTNVVDTANNESLIMYPLNPDYQYTIEVSPTDDAASGNGNSLIGLHSMTLYSMQVHDSWVNHVPWPIVGGVVGGVVVVLVIAGVLWRSGAMFFRRRRRNSVLFEAGSSGDSELKQGSNYRSSTYNDTMEMPLLAAAAPTGHAGQPNEYSDFAPMSHTPRGSVSGAPLTQTPRGSVGGGGGALPGSGSSPGRPAGPAVHSRNSSFGAPPPMPTHNRGGSFGGFAGQPFPGGSPGGPPTHNRGGSFGSGGSGSYGGSPGQPPRMPMPMPNPGGSPGQPRSILR